MVPGSDTHQMGFPENLISESHQRTVGKMGLMIEQL